MLGDFRTYLDMFWIVLAYATRYFGMKVVDGRSDNEARDQENPWKLLAICHREAFLEVQDVSATRLDVGVSEYIYICMKLWYNPYKPL
jgi:hypothetical protein